jgi:hypothetical protein
MATDILSKLQTMKAEIINKPKPPVKMESVEPPKVSTKESIDTSVESSIKQIETEIEAKLKELYNSSELIFTKIVENLQSQVKSKPNVTKLIGQYLKNNGNQTSKYNAEAKSGIMSNEIFNSFELIKQVITNPNPNNIAQLSTITKLGIEFQHSLSQKIVIIQNLVKIAKENKIIVDQSTINKFFDYYDSVEKAVTNSQKELAIAQEPYNGLTLGYFPLVTNPVKEITGSFRVNPYYNTGDILKSTEEDAQVKEIGLVAERKVNSAMSSVEGMVMVIAGPNFSEFDTVRGLDSLTFYSKNVIDLNVRKRLVELAYKISYAAYQESLIKDYHEADPMKMRKHEVVPKSYKEAIENLELAETGLNVYFNDITLIQLKISNYEIKIQEYEANIADLKLKKTSKADTGTQNSIEKERKKTKVLTDKIDKHKIEIMTLEQIIEEKQKLIKIQKLDAKTIYLNYNPQGLAVPLALSPNGQIEVYQDGLKIQYKPDGYSDYTKPDDIYALEDEFNALLIANDIRTNAIQIKLNANIPRVIEAIKKGKYTGAIGTSMDYNSEPITLKSAIALSLNLDDTIETLSTPLKSTSKVRSR